MERFLYVDLAKIPPVRQPKKTSKDQVAASAGRPAALSQGLHQGLQQGLYQGLFQGYQTRDIRDIDAPAALETDSAAPESVDVVLPTAVETPSPGIKIRKVDLLAGETVTHTFCPEEGLIAESRDQGRMLVLTNQRVIAFGNKDGARETVLMPVDEVKAVAVTAGLRSKLMLIQGGLIVMAGIVIYVVLAYWLTGRIDGPTVPIIRMDLVAFLVFLIILTSVGTISQFYFSKPDGEVTFQGDGVRLTFPFRGEAAEDDIYQIVNAAFAARQSMMGSSGIVYSGQGAK